MAGSDIAPAHRDYCFNGLKGTVEPNLTRSFAKLLTSEDWHWGPNQFDYSSYSDKADVKFHSNGTFVLSSPDSGSQKSGEWSLLSYTSCGKTVLHMVMDNGDNEFDWATHTLAGWTEFENVYSTKLNMKSWWLWNTPKMEAAADA